MAKSQKVRSRSIERQTLLSELMSLAVMFYSRAAEISPGERAPWTNLSAAYFELGDHQQAFAACDTALSLINPTAEDYHSIKQKHIERRAKACLFLGRYKDAAGAASGESSAQELVDHPGIFADMRPASVSVHCTTIPARCARCRKSWGLVQIRHR